VLVPAVLPLLFHVQPGDPNTFEKSPEILLEIPGIHRSFSSGLVFEGFPTLVQAKSLASPIIRLPLNPYLNIPY